MSAYTDADIEYLRTLDELVDTTDSGIDEEAPPTSSWRPVDLGPALAGEDLQPATILTRDNDTVSLLYPDRVHWFQGESESLKSWAAQLATAQVLTAGGRVLYIDYEDDERGVVARLLAMSIDRAAILDRLTYLRPDEPLATRSGQFTAGWLDLAGLLEQARFDLVVIDGVTEAMTTEGLELVDNADIATWIRRLPRPLADTGAAVVCIDHVTKDREGRGRYAIGGQHKLAGISGASYTFNRTRTLARALGAEPVTGAAQVIINKDRPGWVRSHATSDDRIATLEVTAYPDGGVTARLVAPGVASDAPPWPLCEKILRHLATYEGSSKKAVEDAIEAKATTVRAALAWMAAPEQEWVRVEQVGQAHRHYLTEAGEELLNA